MSIDDFIRYSRDQQDARDARRRLFTSDPISAIPALHDLLDATCHEPGDIYDLAAILLGIVLRLKYDDDRSID